MEKENVSRLSIGGFFTVEPIDGLIMADVKKKTYAKGDVVTTLFDTKSGRRLQEGFFTGIENGLPVKVKEIRDFSNEEILKLREIYQKKDRTEILACRPGILAFRMESSIEGIYIYTVFTGKAVLGGFVAEAISKAEQGTYDRLFASAAPEASPPAAEISKPETATSAAPVRTQAAAPAPVFAPSSFPGSISNESRKRLLQLNITNIDNEVRAVSENLKQAKDLLHEDAARSERERNTKDKWAGSLQSEQQKLARAEKDKKQADQDLAAAKAELSSQGFFAFARKKELSSRIETLTRQQDELIHQIKKLGDSVTAMKRERDMEERKMRADTVQINKGEWEKYADHLEKLLGKYQAALQEANWLLSDVKKGKNVTINVRKWTPDPMPSKPSVKEIKTDPDDEKADIICDVLARASTPLTAMEIIAGDPRLADISCQKVSTILHRLKDRVIKVPDGRNTRYKLS